MPLRRRNVFMAPEGNSGASNNAGGGFMQSAMSLFNKAPAAKPNAVIDPSKFKFDPETGKPVGANSSDPTNIEGNKSPVNPLEGFKGMWDTPALDGKEATPSFKLDPEKLKTLADSMDFSSHLTPELQEKLKSGDPQGMQEALNGLGRSAYTRLMEHMPSLTEAYVNARLKHSQKDLGASVKSTMTKQSLDKIAASNPVLKKQLEVVAEQLQSQFPDATPEWMAEQAPKYFVEIAKLVAPDAFKEAPQDPATLPRPGESSFDWEAYVSGKPQPSVNK